MAPIWVPFLYIGALIMGMLTFSRYLRRQKQGKSNASTKHRSELTIPTAKISATEPWFPHHQARDLYITLLQADPPTEEKILMSALLCRAVTDVKRIWQLRDSKQALNILVQKGSLGDETVARFAAAEKELEAEVVDVVADANTFKEGWGQWIFASASEIAQREKIKSVLEGLPKIKQEQGMSHISRVEQAC
jgi:translocation protein SEC66